MFRIFFMQKNHTFAALNAKSRFFMKNYEDIFKESGGVARIQTLQEAGMTYYGLNALLEKGLVSRVKQGVYRLESGEVSADEMVEVARLAPNGVFCLYSACTYYELTTFVSGFHHLAIPKKSRVTLPSYPPIQLYYWSDAPYNLGIETVEILGGTIRMYNVEKTVCDMVKFRNKIGMDTVKEVLHNYVRRKDRKIHLLNQYARQMNIAGVLSNYLDILL